jgi:Na+-transporting NADH:ubiquinone oxidoreductase subunit A
VTTQANGTPEPVFKDERRSPSTLLPVGTASVGSLALLGHDFPGLRPRLAVEVGARVATGDLLFADRGNPRLRHVSPCAGTVRDIVRGSRRSLEALVIDVDCDGETRTFETGAAGSRAGLIDLMLECGLWPALRARPFGHVADPRGDPDALFVTAIDTAPFAPDPLHVIDLYCEDFATGLAAAAKLTAGSIWLCTSPAARIPTPPRVSLASFAGPHPAGLPGTHIHRLYPAGRGRNIWHIGYQDVIALGRLLRSGQIWGERLVTLAGNAVGEPQLLSVLPGACLQDIARGRVVETARLSSGSLLDGRPDLFLGRYHLQVTAERSEAKKQLSAAPPSRLLNFLSRRPPALVPNAGHERAAPANILPVPFLRAISVGDAETAERLGALELVEEDMAMLSRLDRVDYGALLRRTLDDLETMT